MGQFPARFGARCVSAAAIHFTRVGTILRSDADEVLLERLPITLLESASEVVSYTAR